MKAKLSKLKGKEVVSHLHFVSKTGSEIILKLTDEQFAIVKDSIGSEKLEGSIFFSLTVI